MNEWQFKQFYGFGFIVFAALLLILTPVWVEPVGLALGLAICYTQVKDQFIVAWNMRRIDREHEAL